METVFFSESVAPLSEVLPSAMTLKRPILFQRGDFFDNDRVAEVLGGFGTLNFLEKAGVSLLTNRQSRDVLTDRDLTTAHDALENLRPAFQPFVRCKIKGIAITGKESTQSGRRYVALRFDSSANTRLRCDQQLIIDRLQLRSRGKLAPHASMLWTDSQGVAECVAQHLRQTEPWESYVVLGRPEVSPIY